eukprot:TRINITY_DN21588_c0_g1_i1.p2 TRINITY_DN21588_c0_g1~~TRINITY_DN21588_c0_g1_i1.p2  ORF type:complete len:143 (-),score=37.88 TRINITY_DN21588_c0_g1_i1:198-626(-)
MLTGYQPGTFLVRFSRRPGSLAISFVSADGEVSHSLVEHEGVPGNGYRLSGQDTIFSTLREVIAFYGDALRYPLKTLSNELQVEGMHIILRWKAERSKQMEGIDRIVTLLFDETKPMPPMSSHRIEIDEKVNDLVDRLFNVV